jgi:hypothetical protein
MHRILVLTAGFCAVASLTVHGQAARTLTTPASPDGVIASPGSMARARTAPAPRATGASPSLDPRVLPGTPASAFSTTIQGNALDTSGRIMPDTPVRLRDARSGRIVESQLTDDAGRFSFEGLDPGTYIVEVLSNESQILAASQMLSVNAGDALSAVVKLPFRIPPFAGFLGHTVPSAAVVAGAAASAQVLAAAATQESSPE